MRRSGQARKQLDKYSPANFFSSFSLSTTVDYHRMVEEAIDSMKGELWKKAMEEKMESLRKNDTWDVSSIAY